MRYIEKIQIKNIDKEANLIPLLNYIDSERNPANPLNPPRHPNFVGMKSDNRGETQKSLLRQLIRENYGLCSFCQETVTKPLIEHLLPQSIFKNQEVDYYNLFFCCDTKSQCSDAKKDILIANFITHTKCEYFFKYNWSGEILPNCNYFYWEGDEKHGCKENIQKLTQMQLQAYLAIDILNLNRDFLKTKRQNNLNANNFRGLLMANKSNREWLLTERAKYIPNGTTRPLPEFSAMFLYFIDEQLKKVQS